MNLFALTDDPSRRILRIPLAQGVQTEVEQLFRSQEASFAAAGQEEIEFDGKYKPDENECLVIKSYDDLDNIHEAIGSPLATPEISADPAAFVAVKALFTGYTSQTNEKIALIQSFDKRKIISSAGFSLIHSANVYRKLDGAGLTLDNKLSAILIDDTLKFFSFHVLRRIADVSQYFVEATNADLNDFAALDAILVEDNAALIVMADSWIRRKITLISQSKILDLVETKTIKDAAAQFNIGVITKLVDDREVIVLPTTKAELKKLLRFLDEDYFHSSLQNLAHMTNSKRRA